jgi:hypothetical protein
MAFFNIEITVFSQFFGNVDAQVQIDTRNIANNAITSAKIEDGQVKTPDIANNAITTSKIPNGAIETNDFSDNSVTSEKIADGTITNADLSPGTSLPSASSEKLRGVSHVIFDTCSIDFSSVLAHQLVFASCPVPGVRIGDKVIVTGQDLALDLITQSASVNATDLVGIAVLNPNPYSGDPQIVTWAMIIFRS